MATKAEDLTARVLERAAAYEQRAHELSGAEGREREADRAALVARELRRLAAAGGQTDSASASSERSAPSCSGSTP